MFVSQSTSAPQNIFLLCHLILTKSDWREDFWRTVLKIESLQKFCSKRHWGQRKKKRKKQGQKPKSFCSYLPACENSCWTSGSQVVGKVSEDSSWAVAGAVLPAVVLPQCFPWSCPHHTPPWVRWGACQAQTHWIWGSIALATASLHLQMHLASECVPASPSLSSCQSCSSSAQLFTPAQSCSVFEPSLALPLQFLSKQ